MELFVSWHEWGRAERYYFAQTVTYIVPLAGTDPWFTRWYAAWQRDFADLA